MIDVACRHDRVFRFDPARAALLVIDMQRDFLDLEGYCAAVGDVSGLRAVMPNVKAVTAAARDHGLHVIHTREGYLPDLSDMNAMKRERKSAAGPGPLGRFLVRGEPGQDFMAEFMPRAGEPVFDKPGFSAFHRTTLDEHLRGRAITHLVVTGITTQCCVHSTLRAAVDLGYWCLTLEDCCAALDRRWHDAAIELIASENHLFGWVSSADRFSAALDGQGRRIAV